ncbi:hypothetical protein AB0E59_17730 [Lentzea sp. NPDC034063]|uniref:hypothetical protein n=1 Tax=unclassified Lentzea TaxID=2643253 RepID=UPI0033C33D1B
MTFNVSGVIALTTLASTGATFIAIAGLSIKMIEFLTPRAALPGCRPASIESFVRVALV